MSILAAYMVPHPPLIVTEIGRGEERQIAETAEAYDEVARDIARISPDTIIITSPHSVMYSDWFHISPGKTARGSFSSFGAGGVKFSEEYDSELAGEIERRAELEGFPAGTLGEKDPSLDHGTMVPLWFIRKYLKTGKLVRIGLSGQPLTDHYRLGQMIKDSVEALGRKAVFIGSGDLSHKLQTYGPYGFAEEGPQYDERIMDVMGRAAFGELFGFSEDFLDKAAECGHRSFVIMAGALDGTAVSVRKLSHQDITGVGYGICMYHPMGEDVSRRFLYSYLEDLERELNEKNEASDAYVRLARSSLESYIRFGKKISVPDGLPKEMKNQRAGAFVSIHKHGYLRGCIGTIVPTRDSVAEEIIENAISASTRDPRFSPITEDEHPWLEISVDVLGEAEPIDSPEELDPRRYGVIVTSGRKRGLLLPDLEGVDTPAQQIDIASRKAGIPKGERISLERFEVIRHT